MHTCIYTHTPLYIYMCISFYTSTHIPRKRLQLQAKRQVTCKSCFWGNWSHIFPPLSSRSDYMCLNNSVPLNRYFWEVVVSLACITCWALRVSDIFSLECLVPLCVLLGRSLINITGETASCMAGWLFQCVYATR